MKIKRQKKAQRILMFYRNNFAFRPPYHIVLDGTFCQKALNNKINLREQIPKYFGDEVKLLTTACILTELEKLGESIDQLLANEFSSFLFCMVAGAAVHGALVIVKQFPLRKCGHEKDPISASKCLLSLVRRQNAEHYVIATQDFAVMAKLADRPCCPILSLKGNAVTLAKPSMSSRDIAEANVTEMQSGIADQEVAEVRELTAQELGSTGEGKRKRKKRGGPNPLSCKKKKSKATAGAGSMDDSATAKKRHRMRQNRGNRSGACLGKHFQRIVDSVNKSS